MSHGRLPEDAGGEGLSAGWLALPAVRPGVVLAAALAAAALAALGLGRLETDNSPRVFIAREGRLPHSLDELGDLFGAGPALRLAWRGRRLWSGQGLGWLERTTRAAARVPGVAAAHGPLDLDDWWQDADSPAAVARRLAGDPLVRAGGWVTARGDVATIVVELAPALSREERRRALAALERLAATAPAGVERVVVGLPVIERALDRSHRRLLEGILPTVAVLSIVLLAAAWRRPVDVAVPLSVVAAGEAASLGLMGWSGARLNAISGLVVPLLLVLGLVAAVHLQIRFRHHRRLGLGAPAAAAAALRDRIWAIFWAAFTTAAAFASFTLSGLPALRSLGLWTAAGVGLMVLAVWAMQAPALALLGGAAGPDRPWFDRLGRRLGEGLARRATTRRGRTIAGLALIGALAAAGLPRLSFESSLLAYFAPGHPVREDFAAVADWGAGAVPAELLLRLRGSAAEVSFRDPERLERLAELAEELRAEPGVLGALGAGDLFRAAGRRAMPGGPQSEATRWLVLGLLQTEPEARRRFARLVTPDGRAARLTLLAPVSSHETFLPLLERAAARTRHRFPEASVEWTGEYPLVLTARRDLLATVAVSLALTGLVVSAVLGALVRRPGPWAAAAAVNLWPLLVAGGLMGWTGIPLDSSTVMIAAVVLGIGVDDTLHTLGELRRCRGAVVEAIGGVAAGQLLTTLVLGLGFAACGLSDFLPIARFGLLVAAALAAALAGDWLLLPALLGRRVELPSAVAGRRRR